jgi:hypothetical protein
MLLRASGEQTAEGLDLRIVVGQSADAEGGIPHGALLRRFVVAVIGDDPGELVGAREALVAALGSERAGQAAGIVAGFDAINRIADATGITLDQRSERATRDLVEQLDLGEMRSDVSVAQSSR